MAGCTSGCVNLGYEGTNFVPAQFPRAANKAKCPFAARVYPCFVRFRILSYSFHFRKLGLRKALKTGCLVAGYPLPGKIRQAQFGLPPSTKWQGLKLKAEIEVKGMRHPVRWACRQRLNNDGTLSLRPNLREQV